MTDLTPIFRQCVLIVEEANPVAQPRRRVHPTINDTFIAELKQVHQHLVALQHFVSSVRPAYLATNDQASLEEKNATDEEFKLRSHQAYEKLKILQAYEKKRQAAAAESAKPKGLLGFFDTSDDDSSLFVATIATHRTQILRHLTETANHVNKQFESMHAKRQRRERQLNSLNFQNLHDDVDLDFDDEPEVYEPLTQAQIQEFDEENQQFLTLKTNQLEAVEKLHNSMVEIVNLQSELLFQLETQADQISGLLENQDQIDLDLKLGNKTLHKATHRNKRGANMIVSTCLVLGFLLLFIDYVS